MGGPTVENAQLVKLLMKRASLIASTLRSRTDEYKSQLINEMLSKCGPLFKDKQLDPVIDRVFNLSEVSEAHAYMESNASTGKIILRNDL